MRVVLVEDEPLVADLARVFLINAGHSVSVAPTGRAAMALFLTEKPSFDVLVTDLGLPDVPGSAVIAAARSANPFIAVVIVTGAAHGEIPKCDAIVEKPYGRVHLVMTVAAVIDAKRDADALRERKRSHAMLASAAG